MSGKTVWYQLSARLVVKTNIIIRKLEDFTASLSDLCELTTWSSYFKSIYWKTVRILWISLFFLNWTFFELIFFQQTILYILLWFVLKLCVCMCVTFKDPLRFSWFEFYITVLILFVVISSCGWTFGKRNWFCDEDLINKPISLVTIHAFQHSNNRFSFAMKSHANDKWVSESTPLNIVKLFIKILDSFIYFSHQPFHVHFKRNIFRSYIF